MLVGAQPMENNRCTYAEWKTAAHWKDLKLQILLILKITLKFLIFKKIQMKAIL